MLCHLTALLPNILRRTVSQGNLSTGCYDGIRFCFEEVSSGTVVIFVHEFAGDLRNWEPQLLHFGRRYRAIAFNTRGYPPSDVPETLRSYFQHRATDDIADVLDHLQIEKAHVVGLLMGGFAMLHFGFRYAGRHRSLCVAGCGYGAEQDRREKSWAEADAIAAVLQRDGLAAFVSRYGPCV